jgi:Transglycosylase SLT domain
MTALRSLSAPLRTAADATGRSVNVFLRDVGHGMLEVSHNTLALVGLLLVGTTVFVFSRPDLRHAVEVEALGWLQARHEVRQTPAEALAATLAEPDAIARATASDPKHLTRQQAHVAQWISRRYRVAPEPISRLVEEAWQVGERAGIDPTLILAIMAIESSFNPFAQSSVGAQGLMQVMTKVHDDKYEAFGGTFAAFDPVTNLRVGVQVLKECIQRAGSLEAGLRFYVGAANLTDDGGYAGKVLAEQSQLKLVALGKPVPVNTPATVPVAASTPATVPAATPAAPYPTAPATPDPDAPTPDQLALLRS